jgi:hypothetical protein
MARPKRYHYYQLDIPGFYSRNAKHFKRWSVAEISALRYLHDMIWLEPTKSIPNTLLEFCNILEMADVDDAQKLLDKFIRSGLLIITDDKMQIISPDLEMLYHDKSQLSDTRAAIGKMGSDARWSVKTPPVVADDDDTVPF